MNSDLYVGVYNSVIDCLHAFREGEIVQLRSSNYDNSTVNTQNDVRCLCIQTEECRLWLSQILAC